MSDCTQAPVDALILCYPKNLTLKTYYGSETVIPFFTGCREKIYSELGDLKESPSLGESSHVMFSRMAKYSSLTSFYTFSKQQPKATEDKVCLH